MGVDCRLRNLPHHRVQSLEDDAARNQHPSERGQQKEMQHHRARNAKNLERSNLTRNQYENVAHEISQETADLKVAASVPYLGSDSIERDGDEK